MALLCLLWTVLAECLDGMPNVGEAVKTSYLLPDRGKCVIHKLSLHWQHKKIRNKFAASNVARCYGDYLIAGCLRLLVISAISLCVARCTAGIFLVFFFFNLYIAHSITNLTFYLLVL